MLLYNHNFTFSLKTSQIKIPLKVYPLCAT